VACSWKVDDSPVHEIAECQSSTESERCHFMNHRVKLPVVVDSPQDGSSGPKGGERTCHYLSLMSWSVQWNMRDRA